jgi:hypothetical protein
MVKCKYETSNGRCGMKDCYAYRHKCYTEEFCKCHQPQTNADRIRAMSDDELAKILNAFTTYFDECNRSSCEADCKDCELCELCSLGESKALEWLKQPSE